MEDRIRWRRHTSEPLCGLRGPDADYVMRHDKYAAEAFNTLCKRMSKKEAKRLIEECFAAAFWWMMFIPEGVRDARPECWALLAEGLSVERIFPDLEELGNWNPSRGTAAQLQ